MSKTNHMIYDNIGNKLNVLLGELSGALEHDMSIVFNSTLTTELWTDVDAELNNELDTDLHNQLIDL